MFIKTGDLLRLSGVHSLLFFLTCNLTGELRLLRIEAPFPNRLCSSHTGSIGIKDFLGRILVKLFLIFLHMPTLQRQDPFGGWSLEARDPETIANWMPVWEWFYRHYFRVQSDGWDRVPTDSRERVLFVGSHNGGIASPDLPMFMVDWFRRFGFERQIYGLMHPKVWQVARPMAELASRLGAIQAHPKMAFSALRR